MPRVEKQHEVDTDSRGAIRAPIGCVAVHREFGKVEVFAVDGNSREIRIPDGGGYRHVVIHVDSLTEPSVDDLLGIKSHEDRVLMNVLVGHTV